MSLLHGKKILVVDDETYLRQMYREELEMQGAFVTEADGGGLALSLIKLNSYDIVVTDILMPLGDGVSLIRNINLLGKPVPKLVISTGNAVLEAHEMASLGVKLILTKPFDLGTFVKALEGLFA